MKTIGEKIKELLSIRKMTQSELAKQSGISPGLISMLINNTRTDIMMDSAKKLAKALGIHPAYFFEDEVLGPSEILPYLTDKEKETAFTLEKLPWIKLNSYAEDKGFTPDEIRQLIDIMFNKVSK